MKCGLRCVFKCGLSTWHWTLFNHLAVWGSCVFYFISVYLLMSDVWSLDPEYQSTLSVLSSTALFWLTAVISVSMVVIPVFAVNSFMAGVRPTITDRIQQVQQSIGHCPQPRPRCFLLDCIYEYDFSRCFVKTETVRDDTNTQTPIISVVLLSYIADSHEDRFTAHYSIGIRNGR